MQALSRVRRSVVSVLVGATLVVASLGGAFGATAGAATVKSPKPTCSTVTPKMIKADLHLTVSAGMLSSAGTDFICQYGDSISTFAVVIEYNTAGSGSIFTTVKAGFNDNREPTTSVGKDFGSLVNQAFSASLLVGPYTQHSVVALQRKLQIDIASSAPISDLIKLMKQVLLLV
jgi:hypothetical protein